MLSFAKGAPSGSLCRAEDRELVELSKIIRVSRVREPLGVAGSTSGSR